MLDGLVLELPMMPDSCGHQDSIMCFAENKLRQACTISCTTSKKNGACYRGSDVVKVTKAEADNALKHSDPESARDSPGEWPPPPD